HDVSDRIARLDRRYPDDFALSAIPGYAGEHALTIDLGAGSARRPILLLTGWTGYAFSSNRVAASQAGLSLVPPFVQVHGADGRQILGEADDQFVIARPGDEITLSFDAAAIGPVPDGSARTFFLIADGFSKEMDINSASPDTVEPLPFHAMSRYPYGSNERYP